MRSAIRIIPFVLCGLMVLSLGAAQEKGKPSSSDNTWSGYLVDKNCGEQIAKKEQSKAMAMGKKHSVACGLDEACMASGYGIIHEGQFVKFDDAGDTMAAEYLKNLTKKNDVLVEVSGTLDGSILKVSKITDGKPADAGKEKKN